MKPKLSTLINGTRVGKAARGAGRSLVFDFYDDLASTGKETFHLWLYLTDWTISINDVSLLASHVDDDAVYEQVLDQLIGSQITEAKVDGSNLVIKFDDQYTIELCPNFELYEASDELFMFFDRTKSTILSYSPAAGLVLE